MRKIHQQRILDALKTLSTAADDVKRLLSRRDVPSAVRLLAVCGNSAAQVASIIKQLEGEGTKTVSCLNECCELLAQVNEAVSVANVNQGLLKKLQKQLIKTGNCAVNELKPDKVEMVFLPYKASMWDSMESIWAAAKDDPLCDAYVVPIPYYEKTTGGKLGEQRYEGGLYPAYVPVTHWKDYNLGERSPDVIFFHNPYDQNNIVTEVHSDFFSERLKNFTNLLVYVPYFITYGHAVAGNFCLQTGVLNADRVIVESEAIRQSYINTLNVYKKSIGNRRGVFENLTKNIVALGSPKIDKIIKSKSEHFVLPDEWDKLINKSGQEKKKVVLYNVRFTDMTPGIENQLAKLEFALEIFKNLSGVVLWLRPHPLNETCLRSMRPYVLERYISIINDYKNAGWGIYDETPDLHRAIAISDAYYGDESSLLLMYRVAGKPAIIHNVSMLWESKQWNNTAFNNCTGKTGNFIEFEPLTGELREESIDVTGKSSMQKFLSELWDEKKTSPDARIDLVSNEELYTLPFIDQVIDFALRPETAEQNAYGGIEIAHSDGKAGIAIYEYCKNECL